MNLELHHVANLRRVHALESTVAEYFDIATYKDPAGVDILVSSTPWPSWRLARD